MKENKKSKNTVFVVILLVLVLASLVVGAINFVKLQSSEWICIASECTEYARGQDWVKQNCALEGTEMMCKFQLGGENFRVPLSGIQNVSSMVSCSKYECVSKALVSNKK